MTFSFATIMRATAFALGALAVVVTDQAVAGTIVVFHADSLGGPMRELKKAFEAKTPGVTIDFTPGTSKQLAERILKGETCDVFAPSSDQVMDQEMLGKKISGTDVRAASWYAVFSANEMVVITPKGNPKGIKKVSDLAGVKFLRITAEKDLATGRTIEFLKRAASLEGKAELAQKIIDASAGEPGKPSSVPETVRAVREGAVDAGVVYYSAAVAARSDIETIRFPAGVNMSEAIRNAITVTGTAKNAAEGLRPLHHQRGRPAHSSRHRPAADRSGDLQGRCSSRAEEVAPVLNQSAVWRGQGRQRNSSNRR
jgi:molybdate transport system substrate-binding protein